MLASKLRACSTPDAMKSEQKAGKPEVGNDSLENFIRQANGKDPFLSFSRAGDSPVQWIQLLHALDQQGTDKLSKGPKINNTIEGKERSLKPCNGVSSCASEINGVKESVHPIKSSGLPVKGTKSASEQMQTLKIPEAVVAFAQAAAKANGEPEKYLPGWPLFSPPKMQLQKCDKCSREFCSPINYRRHIRVHRRSLNIDKDSAKNRGFLGEFWDKLCLDEAMEIVSFKNVTLEEVPGFSIIRAWTSFIRKPGFSSLPQVYVKAGAALLDIVQARPSRFPISSQELFSILDDASEKTFLCAGTAVSVQKFVFDGEAGKIGLEMRNLVACTSFLVKAWLADKDAEALRCQKLLVEEEEAAQKRQAELLQRRRLKKLRQREQKAKEQRDVEKADLKENTADTLEALSISGETSSPVAASDFDSHILDLPPDPVTRLLTSDSQTQDSPPDPVTRLRNTDAEVSTRAHDESGNPDSEMTSGYADSAHYQNVNHQLLEGSGQRQLIVVRRQLPKPQRDAPNGFHVGQVPPVSKLGVMQKHGVYRDQRAASMANGHKVWTRKTKPENGEGLDTKLKESKLLPDQNENCEVFIGSISVILGDCIGQQPVDTRAAALDLCVADHPLERRNNVQEKSIKSDSGQSGTNWSVAKLWRPVGTHEAGGSALLQNDKREAEVNVVTGTERALSNESCMASGDKDGNNFNSRNDSPTLLKASQDSRGPRVFSRFAAEAFLAQRWKEAIAADHLKLVLSLESEPPGCLEKIQNDVQVAAPWPLDPGKCSILSNAENRLANVGLLEPSTTGASKAKFRAKPEKSCKLKYMPKQRNIT
ncbi:hypothetical protein HHK36_000211 [Tetracentron sinense]|uniref:C2H2-type domain-containing protein n=1 Tax=Tetracentron sinense TaxID=13715 RepID=A0A835A0K8_TETSI|nr:hypothetical protein HHK36_000211 [Tetracentron sinense]